MSETVDYYQVLGVSPRASSREIKQAYRALAMQYHPDRNADEALAERKTKEINAAYEVLKSPRKRFQYDAQRAAAAPLSPSGTPNQTAQAAPKTSPPIYVPSWFEWIEDMVYNFSINLPFEPRAGRSNLYWVLLLLFSVDRAYRISFVTTFGETPFHDVSMAFSVVYLLFYLFWLLFCSDWHWLYLLAFCLAIVPSFMGKAAFSGWIFFAMQVIITLTVFFAPDLLIPFVLFYQPLFTIEPLKPII